MSKWLKVNAVCVNDGEENIQPGCIRISEIISINRRYDGCTEIIMKGDMSHSLRVQESYEDILAAITE